MKLFPLFSLLLITISISAQSFYINEDFNNSTLPSNWNDTILSGNFGLSVGIDASVGDPGNNNLDGTPLLYFDDDSHGNGNLNNTVQLISPVFDNSNDSSSWLEFDYNFRQFPGINDYFKVEVFDGTNWQTLLNQTTDNCGRWVTAACINNFPHAKINISNYKNTNCQIRFTYHDGNDWCWYFGLDNVQVYSYLNNDLALQSILRPISCGLPQDSVKVSIKNVGFDSSHSFTMSYVIDNQPSISQQVNATLPFDSSINLTFSVPFTRSDTSTQQIQVYLSNNADQNQMNDTINKIVPQNISYALPYNNNFENNNDNWLVSGKNPSWARGKPTTNNINIAARDSFAYVTNPAGIYNSNEFSYIESPCFDLSNTFTNFPPVMSMSINFFTEENQDKAWMEYSIDGGFNWSKLSSGNQYHNWYNNTSQGFWSGSSNGWIQVSNQLNQLIGEPNVKFRFAFQSNISTNLQGFAFDNFSVSRLGPDNVAINRILYPTNTSGPQINHCLGVDTSEYISIEVLNLGQRNLSRFFVGIQLDNGPIYRDTAQLAFNTIPPGGSYVFTLSTPVHFNQNKEYQIKAWASDTYDFIAGDDTIYNKFIDARNRVQYFNLPYSQDFNSTAVGTIPNGWSTQLLGPAQNPTWTVSADTTPSISTGPRIPGTKFVFLEGSYYFNNQEGELYSPCIKIRDNTKKSIRFDYHKYGNHMGDLFLDIYNGISWINGIDRINGQTHSNPGDTFITRTVNLNPYIAPYFNRIIKFRFRGTYGTGYEGDMAIDNVQIVDDKNMDASLSYIQYNHFDNCIIIDSTLDRSLRVQFWNQSVNPINSNDLQFNYQINNGPVVSEYMFAPLCAGCGRGYTFKQDPQYQNFTPPIQLKVWINLPNDTNQSNDTLYHYLDLQTLPFVEDFESLPTGNFGYKVGKMNSVYDYSSSLNYSWTYGNSNNMNNGTGPSIDHTLGNSNGRFAKTNSNRPNGTYAYLNTPCFTVSQNALLAKMEFWYHKYGQNMNDLKVDVYRTDTHVWDTNLIVISGVTQSSSFAPWLKDSIDLLPYSDKTIRVRFRVDRDTINFLDDIAVDDIRIYDSTLTTSLNKFASNQVLRLYPNPSKGQYFIQSTEDLNGVQYQVYNLQSKLIHSGRFAAGQNQIDLSDQSKGIYLLQIEEYGIRQKLIKY